MNEREVIKGCLENSRRSQKELYDHYYGPLIGVCLRYAESEDHAHEILQNGFLKIYKALKHYKQVESLDEWMKKVMIDVAVHYTRKEDKDKRHIVSTVHENRTNFDPVVAEKVNIEELVPKITYRAVLNALHAMTSGFRIIYNLHFIDGYSLEEIANLLGISELTAKTNYEKAQFAFKNNLIQQVQKAS